MNCECILYYVLNSLNEILANLRSLNQQNICDDNGCYDNIHDMIGLPQTNNITTPSSNSQTIIFGLVGFFILYAILHFLINNQRKKVANGFEKINLRENPDRNGGEIM